MALGFGPVTEEVGVMPHPRGEEACRGVCVWGGRPPAGREKVEAILRAETPWLRGWGCAGGQKAADAPSPFHGSPSYSPEGLG